MAEKKTNEFVQLGGILCAITAVVALCLGAVNAVTVGPIAEQAKLKTEAALASVMDAEVEEQLEVAEGTTINTDKGTSVAIYSAYKMADGAGYCVEVGPTGFGGPVDTMIGIDAEGNITGISVIAAASETPGLGANCTSEEFQGQFQGQPADGSVAVEKDGGSIVAITGATITSRCVAEGVNAAAKYVAELG